MRDHVEGRALWQPRQQFPRVLLRRLAYREMVEREDPVAIDSLNGAKEILAVRPFRRGELMKGPGRVREGSVQQQKTSSARAAPESEAASAREFEDVTADT